MMFRMILLTVLIALLKTPGAFARGDGTLPLRLPGDGTLPLKLSGNAIQAQSELATKITLTSATAAKLTGAAANAVTCKITGADITKHAAQGTVLVGLAQYTVKGICFNQDTSEMEVVAHRGTERSFMAGGLAAPEPDAFAGRLVITGASSPAGNYTFSMRSVSEHLGGGNQ